MRPVPNSRFPAMNRMTGGTGVRELSNCIDGFFTRALICQPMLRTAPAAALAAGLLLSNVDRVEMARGPLSAVWGSSAMAGAVQFITRQGEAGPTQLEALAEGGTASSHGPQARSELSAVGGTPDLRYSAGVGVA